MLKRLYYAGLIFFVFMLSQSFAQRGLGGVSVKSQENKTQSSGKYYALVIGNDNYKYLSKLKTAIRDAEEVEKTLKERYSFNTKLLIDAKRADISHELNRYIKLLKRNDSFLLYYAGHGIFDKVGKKAYWLPVDAMENDDTYWIMADSLTTKIRRMSSKHVLIVADSCYSGAMTRGKGYVEKMLTKASRTLLASGGNEPVLDSGNNKHSVFANAFISALKNINKPSFTAEELFYGYIKERVVGNSEQTPEYGFIRNSGHDGGDFVFLKIQKTKGQLSLKALSSVFSLSDLEDRVKNIEVGSVLNEMRQGFKKVSDYQKRKIPSNLKVIAWQRFIEAFSDDYPYSLEDNELREKAMARIRYWKTKKNEPKDSELSKGVVSNYLGMKFVYISPGAFMMGSPPSEVGRYRDEKRHKVSITNGFYMQTTEVTQKQWKEVMGDNPSYFSSCGDDCPVESVSWADTQKFIKKLNKEEEKYRLPSEAEWEYACRAGSDAKYTFGSDVRRLVEYAWYDNNSESRVHRVGEKKTNAWGLYDMHGNVWEWCADWYNDYSPSHLKDPLGVTKNGLKVFRGGSWYDISKYVRSAVRSLNTVGSGYNIVGFRVLMLP